MRIMNSDPYMAYYNHQQQQTGGAITQVFRGSPYQRGHGVGSFLGGMFRTIAPLFKSGVKTVGGEALKTGIGFLGDIAGGTMNPKVAASARLREFTESLKRKADDRIDRVLRGGGGGLCAKRRRVARKKNALRATRKTSAKRAMRGGRLRRVTPQSLTKLLRGKTYRKRTATATKSKKRSKLAQKKNKKKTNRKTTKKSVTVRDIFSL